MKQERVLTLKLKRLLADPMLDNVVLKEQLGKP
jgi:hypothetical protein